MGTSPGVRITRYSNGAARERRIMRKLEEEGYYTIRSAGSHGVADIVAVKKGEVRFIQSKTSGYLTPEERAKGFVRPVRRVYTHLTCKSDTTMSPDIAETYARDPGFYTGTFCVACGSHLPLDEFVWKDTNERVGS